MKLSKDINYSFFMFSQLFMTYHNEYGLTEYDILYPIILVEYGKYEVSAFNTADKSEHDCMIEYMTKKDNNGIKTTNSI